MPITVTENFESRVISESNSGVTMKKVYTVKGTYDPEAAFLVVPQIGDVEVVLGKDLSVLSRDIERLETIEAMKVTINYGQPEGSSGGGGGGGGMALTWELDLTVESERIRQVKKPELQRDFPESKTVGTAIGERNGEIEGCDIYVPRSQLVINKWWEDVNVTTDYLQTLQSATGKINDTFFWLWYPGDVLFTGAKVSKDQAAFTRITYEFLASLSKILDITFTDVEGNEQTIDLKMGWEYLWYKEIGKVEESGGEKTTKYFIDSAHVAKVYDSFDFSLIQVPTTKP